MEFVYHIDRSCRTVDNCGRPWPSLPRVGPTGCILGFEWEEEEEEEKKERKKERKKEEEEEEEERKKKKKEVVVVE